MAESTAPVEIRTNDGRRVPVRPIRPADLTALQRFHRRLSPQSIYLRHFGTVPVLSDRLATYFTHVDDEHRFALVALDPEVPSEIIAVIRYDRDPGSDRAEYAALVEDRWQGNGIGIGVTRLLIDAARARGITRLYALVLPENLRMQRLLETLMLPATTRWVDGTLQIEVTITGTVGC